MLFAISSITLRQLIDPNPRCGRIFLQRHLTTSPLPSKLAVSRAPVAQLDRASDYGAISLRRFYGAYYGICYGLFRPARSPFFEMTAYYSSQIDNNLTR